jgi:hypothetical protein
MRLPICCDLTYKIHNYLFYICTISLELDSVSVSNNKFINLFLFVKELPPDYEYDLIEICPCFTKMNYLIIDVLSMNVVWMVDESYR